VKVLVSFLLLLAVLLGTSVSASAQTSQAAHMEQLKGQMNAQQKLLEKQQAQIQALESALEQQRRMLAKAVQPGAEVNAPVEAHTGHTEVKSVEARDQQPLTRSAWSSGPKAV
jgi:hypothetical protein